MIPLKLELYNFLAYRSPEPLDLTGLHLACLAGANGAGKSSLLDAMTWALWGKARARRDDDLIHGDEVEMQVRLTFALERNCYRVTRSRSRKGRGSSMLAIEIQDGKDWRTISEPTIRATQDYIINLLRLDYDTFINSAFLMQGRADEFTQKTPGDRKTILAEILGLDVWSQYEERAKERMRRGELRLSQINTDLDQIDQELEREDEYRAELEAAQEERKGLEEQVAGVSGQVNALHEVRLRREGLISQRNDLAGRTGRDETEYERLLHEAEELEKRLEGYREIAAEQAEIEAGYAALQAARQHSHELNELLLQRGDLKEQMSACERVIFEARNELQAAQRRLFDTRAELERRLQEGSAALDSLAQSEKELEQLKARQAERDRWQDERSDLRQQIAGLEAECRTLQAQVGGLELQREQVTDTGSPACPLCGQPLSEAHRQELLDRLAREREEKRGLYTHHVQQIKDLQASVARLTKQIDKADGELRMLSPKETRVIQLRERVREAENSRSRLAELEQELAELDGVLTSGAYAEEEQARLADIQQQLAALGYADEDYQASRENLAAYQHFESRKSELDHVLKAIPQTEEQLSRLEEQIAAKAAQIGEDQTTISLLDKEAAALAEQLLDLPDLQALLDDLLLRRDQANRQEAQAEQKLHALDQSRQRREKLIGEHQQIMSEYSIYQDLRQAFGKDGIPAMIIEAAIPEIETEANEILSRMTDGRMHIYFETQREKVTGGLKETLDIRIADELGTRDYETFSGGEAFRVNFAIRLALSRLLARRAGAQLRTLIIDEGFGTQDAQGRERLVEAINIVKDDFDLVLVITHIDELKDAFPARIEVTKSREGSLIEVF